MKPPSRWNEPLESRNGQVICRAWNSSSLMFSPSAASTPAINWRSTWAIRRRRLMQQLAKEINFSETTFVTSDVPENGGYNARIFMPEVEVDFAGHPVLGTAFVIQRELIRRPVKQLHAKPASGADSGDLRRRWRACGCGRIRRNSVTYSRRLSWRRCSTWRKQTSIRASPLQEVSTGMAFALAPMVSLEAVRRARVNLDRLRAILGRA